MALIGHGGTSYERDAISREIDCFARDVRSDLDLVGAWQDALEKDLIGVLSGAAKAKPTLHSVFISGKHIDPADDCTLGKLNHSCQPNSEFRGDALLAVREIKANEEIVIDYNATEPVVSNPFECQCGFCGGTVHVGDPT
jgi:hypothetical protein